MSCLRAPVEWDLVGGRQATADGRARYAEDVGEGADWHPGAAALGDRGVQAVQRCVGVVDGLGQPGRGAAGVFALGHDWWAAHGPPYYVPRGGHNQQAVSLGLVPPAGQNVAVGGVV